MRLFLTSLVLFSYACGSEVKKHQEASLSEVAFEQSYIQASCDKAFTCYQTATLSLLDLGRSPAECSRTLAEDSATDTSECDYNTDAGTACMTAMAHMSCEDFTRGDFPKTCSQVCR